MPNPYLDALRTKYDGLREGIKGLQQKALDEERDLSDDELKLVRSQNEEAQGLYTQITELTEIETRNAKVAEMAASLLTGDGTDDGSQGSGGAQTRGKALGITAKDRDPGHYRTDKAGGRHSYFGDLYRSRGGDEAASQRLAEHTRALTTGSQGVGTVPPAWMTEEFEMLARQGRRLANAVRRIPLGDDPRPRTLPKQITGTDAVVAEQTTEGTANAGWDDDAFDSDVDTVSPKATSGKQIVSRQMMDMSDPAMDMLIFGDLMSVYADKVEAKVGAAVVTAAGAAVTTFAAEADFIAAGAAPNSVIDAAIAVRNARKRPADILAMNVTRYGRFLKLRDADGRPLIPNPGVGQAVNVAGVGSVDTDGIIEGLGVIATDGIASAAPESYVALRGEDVILFESDAFRFRFEEQAGPENIVLGIWGYTAVLVRQGGKSTKRVVITDPGPVGAGN